MWLALSSIWGKGPCNGYKSKTSILSAMVVIGQRIGGDLGREDFLVEATVIDNTPADTEEVWAPA
jgi:hypothetical protein